MTELEGIMSEIQPGEHVGILMYFPEMLDTNWILGKFLRQTDDQMFFDIYTSKSVTKETAIPKKMIFAIQFHRNKDMEGVIANT
jgi:hypothetical protein